MGLSEPERLEALLAGEPYRALWRYCRSLAPTREDAEDLLQECLATALLKLAQLRDPLAFRGWIFTVARRCFLDLRRTCSWRERAAAASFDGDAAEALAGQPAEGASDDTLVDAQFSALRMELAALPAAQREVLELHYLHGLSLEEAARVLRISAATARQRVHRGRLALRAALAEEER